MLLDQNQNEEALIIGAGPIGIACAVSARRIGIDPLVIDAGPVVNSIVHYPTGMTFFTTPELLEIGGHPFPCAGQKPTREEAIKYYRGVIRAEGIRVLTYTRLLSADREKDGLECKLTTDRGDLRILCRRLVLATGYYDRPNLIGIPGEDLPHVRHYFDEPHLGFDLDVVVIGGKNSAVEAALNLFRAGARTTLVHRGSEVGPTVKYWMRPDIENRIRAGEIGAHFNSRPVRIDRRSLTIVGPEGNETTLPADRIYALTGFHADEELFRRLGILLDRETGRPQLDEARLETNVAGIHMAGSITAGRQISEIFIENGRFDGEKIFRS